MVDEVKFTFLHYPFPVLKPFVRHSELNLLSAPELAATKAYTIGRRGDYKDYLDLYFVLNDGIITLGDLLILASEKYRTEFNDRLFLEQLLYLDDVPENVLQFLRPAVNKDALRGFFQNIISSIKI